MVALVRQAPTIRVVVSINKGMKSFTPLRLAFFGVVSCAGAIGWLVLWHRSVYGAVPMVNNFIIIDIYPPLFPRVIFLAGFLALLASLVWAIVSRLRSYGG
jgi:hypothetical protein